MRVLMAPQLREPCCSELSAALQRGALRLEQHEWGWGIFNNQQSYALDACPYCKTAVLIRVDDY